ncbi:MAG: hypothetical protein HKN94_11115 [Acidimicrobiales bacterium]|nr:hypothetical protein [Acidimicrobiales bacterium]RZV46784.1 MAG: hypothetical protein EX269_06365 [Acidimicrobiales bacterium]
MEFISHRAGNSIGRLREAESIADVIEVDVHLGVGTRVEVRHAKLLWPTRRLWDRWYLLPRGEDGLAFGDILDAAAPSTVFWLDLKGFTSRLSRRARVAIGDREPLVVSTKPWWILKAFADRPNTRVIRSAGNRTELLLLMRMPSRAKLHGVVVHHRLLTDATIERLKRFGQIYTWSVHDVESIVRLHERGVSGVILDDLSLIEPARRATSGEPEASTT